MEYQKPITPQEKENNIKKEFLACLFLDYVYRTKSNYVRLFKQFPGRINLGDKFSEKRRESQECSKKFIHMQLSKRYGWSGEMYPEGFPPWYVEKEESHKPDGLELKL